MRVPVWLLAWSAAIGIVTAAGAAMSAHEIGTTRVDAVLHNGGSYRVTITTDASALLEKLERVNDTPSTPAPPTTADLEHRLRGLADTFALRAAVTFDGAAHATPDVQIQVTSAPDALPVATISLQGTVPQGAAQVTWRYGWTFASYAFSLRTGPDAEPITMWLAGDATSAPIPIATATTHRVTLAGTARQYLRLGFTHILPLGADHVLFVLGLFLLNSRPRVLLVQVSAFTIAHSITLGLAMWGLLTVPSSIVEPAIALSIICVAVENLLFSELRVWRVWLVFACGLLHGLGFAGVLHEVGLPPGQFAAALLAFNAGVEAAQLTVVGAAFLAVGSWGGTRGWYRARVVMPASVAIACIALVWAVERISR